MPRSAPRPVAKSPTSNACIGIVLDSVSEWNPGVPLDHGQVKHGK